MLFVQKYQFDVILCVTCIIFLSFLIESNCLWINLISFFSSGFRTSSFFIFEKFQVCGEHTYPGDWATSSRGFCKYRCCWKLQTYKKGKGKFAMVHIAALGVYFNCFLFTKEVYFVAIENFLNQLVYYEPNSNLPADDNFCFLCLLQSSYGFIHYFDRRSAALAILSLNGRHL